jgi:hypothetical protein
LNRSTPGLGSGRRNPNGAARIAFDAQLRSAPPVEDPGGDPTALPLNARLQTCAPANERYAGADH